MKKDKLIKLLQDIEGNPDILIWNWMVGDWQDIGGLTPEVLTKQSLKTALDCFRWERCREIGRTDYQLTEDEVDEITESWRKEGYDYNQFVTQENIESGRYLKKEVVLIKAKKRGVSTWDRLGIISY